MEERFVWVTTRRLRPGVSEEFEKAWRPSPYPQGLRRAFAYWSEDGQEITGVSLWESQEACDSWRASEPEAQRRAAMAPYVVEERDGFYRGRELAVLGRGRPTRVACNWAVITNPGGRTHDHNERAAHRIAGESAVPRREQPVHGVP